MPAYAHQPQPPIQPHLEAAAPGAVLSRQLLKAQQTQAGQLGQGISLLRREVGRFVEWQVQGPQLCERRQAWDDVVAAFQAGELGQPVERGRWLRPRDLPARQVKVLQ